MSSLTWLDYSERDRRQMLEIVDLFKKKDTRDELGIGSVRDAFADLLFPGTSTIMTRARYFLLVPWTYQRLEASRTSSAEIEAKARKAELDLVEVIGCSNDKEGNIGRIARRTLKRLPSSVYWQGLGVWGIRVFYGSQYQYHRQFDEFSRRRVYQDSRTKERDNEQDELMQLNWHGGLIKPPEDFPKTASLRLSREEADYLSDQIQFSPMSAGTLLSELVLSRKSSGNVPFVWHHAHYAQFPARLKEQLWHGRNFSELIHGSALLYNHILAVQTKRTDSIEQFADAYQRWARLMADRAEELAKWDRAEFWQLVTRTNPRIPPRTSAFVEQWWDMVMAGKCQRLDRTKEARELIRRREQTLKPPQLARIDNPEAEHDWGGDSGSGQLDFRWGVTQVLLNDIFRGLEDRRA